MLRILILSAVSSAFKGNNNLCTMATAAAATSIQAVDFEVYGKVQGVFFRKYTKAEADKLDVRGWCQNTFKGTVVGHIEGPSDKIGAMMQWLMKKGSPKSVIDRVEFKNKKEIHSYSYQGFHIHESE